MRFEDTEAWGKRNKVPVFTGPDGVELFQLISVKHAIQLEMKGIRFKGGKSVAAAWRRKLTKEGVKVGPGKRGVVEALEALIEEKGEAYKRKHRIGPANG